MNAAAAEPRPPVTIAVTGLLLALFIPTRPPANLNALMVQANTGILTGFRRDATVRSVAVDWRALASDIESIRRAQGATCVLANDYGTTSWLMFYLPKETCVAQSRQRYRWTFMAEPDANLLKGRVLLVGNAGSDVTLRDRYVQTEKLAELTRKRGGVAVETYEIGLLDTAKGDPLDRSPPPELSN